MYGGLNNYTDASNTSGNCHVNTGTLNPKFSCAIGNNVKNQRNNAGGENGEITSNYQEMLCDGTTNEIQMMKSSVQISPVRNNGVTNNSNDVDIPLEDDQEGGNEAFLLDENADLSNIRMKRNKYRRKTRKIVGSSEESESDFKGEWIARQVAPSTHQSLDESKHGPNECLTDSRESAGAVLVDLNQAVNDGIGRNDCNPQENQNQIAWSTLQSPIQNPISRQVFGQHEMVQEYVKQNPGKHNIHTPKGQENGTQVNIFNGNTHSQNPDNNNSHHCNTKPICATSASNSMSKVACNSISQSRENTINADNVVATNNIVGNRGQAIGMVVGDDINEEHYHTRSDNNHPSIRRKEVLDGKQVNQSRHPLRSIDSNQLADLVDQVDDDIITITPVVKPKALAHRSLSHGIGKGLKLKDSRHCFNLIDVSEIDDVDSHHPTHTGLRTLIGNNDNHYDHHHHDHQSKRIKSSNSKHVAHANTSSSPRTTSVALDDTSTSGLIVPANASAPAAATVSITNASEARASTSKHNQPVIITSNQSSFNNSNNQGKRPSHDNNQSVGTGTEVVALEPCLKQTATVTSTPLPHPLSLHSQQKTPQTISHQQPKSSHQQRQRHMMDDICDRVSRHRFHFTPPMTQEGFWDTDFNQEVKNATPPSQNSNDDVFI
jgi:hypothetical protein